MSRPYFLYHLVDEDDSIIYVGMTTSPAQRLSTHRKQKDGVKDMKVIQEFSGPEQCALAEIADIAKYLPKYNVLEHQRAARQAEGIERAKQAGKYKGRKHALTPEQVTGAHLEILAGTPKARVARNLGVSRQTLYSALERMNQ